MKMRLRQEIPSDVENVVTVSCTRSVPSVVSFAHVIMSFYELKILVRSFEVLIQCIKFQLNIYCI